MAFLLPSLATTHLTSPFPHWALKRVHSTPILAPNGFPLSRNIRPPFVAFSKYKQEEEEREEMMKKKENKEEQVEFVTTMPEAGSPEGVKSGWSHPWQPHWPSFNSLLPEAICPYPSFEGWMIRLVDFENDISLGAIFGTNYATSESQATIVFSLPPERSLDKPGMGGMRKTRAGKPGNTHAVYTRTKNAMLKESVSTKESRKESDFTGFEWRAPSIGTFVSGPHETLIDVTIEGYHFKCHMENGVLWDPEDSKRGPEGWASNISILPTHWYIHSLGSKSRYKLKSPEIEIAGSGLSHMEKNWGETFPSGHIWLQAFFPDNTHQLIFSGAYYKVVGDVSMPYIFSLGYRSHINLNMRSNDPGIFFKDMHCQPSHGTFSITAVGPSHTIRINASAPFESFSNSILAPIGKEEWKPACRESYIATVDIKVYEHTIWGVSGNMKLIEKQTFSRAALEFGEDIWEEAKEK